MDKAEFPMVDVLRVRTPRGHRLWVEFTDGSEGERDFAAMVAEGGPMLEPLKSAEYFARVFVESGVLIWPNGFDIDSIHLYMQMRDAGVLRQIAAAE